MRAQPLVLGVGFAGLLIVGACADALHLDPPADTTGASTSTGAGAGGAAAATTAASTTSMAATTSSSSKSATTGTSTSTTASSSTGHGGGTTGATTGSGGASGAGGGMCVSNSECGYPTAVCDTALSKCVECLVLADCASTPGTVCSLGQCICPVGNNTFCPADATSPARCADLTSSANDCGECSHACFGPCISNKCSGPWEETSLVDAPDPRAFHTAVWTGSQMIVWGGIDASGAPLATGGVYDPAGRSWSATNVVGAPEARAYHTAVWDSADKLMIVFGGVGASGELGTGASYDPAKNAWSALPTTGSAAPRQHHTAVWTGTSMVIWGGEHGSTDLASGAIFTPSTAAWTVVKALGAPGARHDHTAVVLGTAMIVWGGEGAGVALGDGASYDLTAKKWTVITASGAPSARSQHTAVVGAGAMLVFGGTDDAGTFLDDGFAYTPDAWSATFSGSAPEVRAGHTAVVTGMSSSEEMLIWGGQNGSSTLATGGRLSTSTTTWTADIPGAPAARTGHTAVSTGAKMILWGGDTDLTGAPTNTGAVFDTTAP